MITNNETHPKEGKTYVDVSRFWAEYHVLNCVGDFFLLPSTYEPMDNDQSPLKAFGNLWNTWTRDINWE